MPRRRVSFSLPKKTDFDICVIIDCFFNDHNVQTPRILIYFFHRNRHLDGRRKCPALLYQLCTRLATTLQVKCSRHIVHLVLIENSD